MKKTKNRWLIAASAVGIHLSIGSVYAWSVFSRPITTQLGWGFKLERQGAEREKGAHEIRHKTHMGKETRPAPFLKFPGSGFIRAKPL
ncbi:MAG: hypothetical protein M0009_02280 [Deltaproteobacteria bacterium]|nr:hypothetical protein [Deltaproteobacteria bacterium]MDA8124004.1 hypothetical protein [Deltaproteobacteria bacterium]